jgi:hypothetical protein
VHASHEPAAPPSHGPSRRRGKVLAATLALFLMVLATLALTTARPPAATAQELPVMAALTGQCAAGQAVFHVEMVNSRTGTFNFAYVLSFGDIGVGNQSGETSLPAGQTFTHDFDPEPGAEPNWRVDIFDVDQGYNPVGQSNTLPNPCLTTTTTTSTTTTTTTSGTTTTTTPTDTTTTDPTTTTDTTTTSDTTLPTTTTTTDPGTIAPVSSEGDTGGLAQTGVAIAVLVGAAAMLLFNGIGLTRITRREWATRNDD